MSRNVGQRDREVFVTFVRCILEDVDRDRPVSRIAVGPSQRAKRAAVVGTLGRRAVGGRKVDGNDTRGVTHSRYRQQQRTRVLGRRYGGYRELNSGVHVVIQNLDATRRI